MPREYLPFILVSPVVPAGHDWRPATVKALAESLLRHPGRLNLDPNRIYLTGFSIGGDAAFYIAEEFPDFFAAVAPLAGWGESSRAKLLKSLPTRAFHGDADEVISYDRSVKMIEAAQAAGNRDAELVAVPGGSHQICPDVYGNPEIYRWLLRHKK